MLKIIEIYEALGISPNSGVPVQKHVSFSTGYRFAKANNYSVFYKIDDETARIVRNFIPAVILARFFWSDAPPRKAQ